MPFPLALLGTIANAGSTIYGAIQEGKQREQMANERQKWNADNEAMYNQDYYSDYTQRADAQNVIRQMRDQMKQQNQVEQNTAAVTGASPETVNAGKEARNKAITNLYGNIAAMGADYKERAKNRYVARKQALQGMEYDTMNQNATSANNLLYNGIRGAANTDWAGILGGYNKVGSGKSVVGSKVQTDYTPPPVNTKSEIENLFPTS